MQAGDGAGDDGDAEAAGTDVGADGTDVGAGARPDRRTALVGARWGVVSAFVEQGGSLLSTAVLARLLTPADFGIVAATTIAVTLFALVGGLGFGAGLIRRDRVDELTLSSTFWAATVVGAVLTVICAVASPLLARALGQPEVGPYLAAISPILLIGMLSNVSEALLQRKLRFSAVYTADVAAIVANVVFSIGFAVAGTGAWALILGRLAGSVVGTAVRVVASGWRPTRRFSWEVVRSDLRFNGGYLGITLGGFTYKNLDNWVVARTQSTAALGGYYVAYVVPNILRQRMTWLSGEVLFPLLARAEGVDAQRRMYERLLRLLTMLAFPVLIGVAAVSPEVVRIGFGTQWAAAVAPMRILSVAAALDVLVLTSLPVFLSRGRPGVGNRVMALRIVTMGAGLAWSVHADLGLAGVAWAVAASTVVAVVVTLAALDSMMGVVWTHLLRDLAPAAVGSAVMYGVIAAVRSTAVGGLGPVLRLIVFVAVGAVSFAGTAWLVDRRTVREWLDFVRELVGGRRSRRPAPPRAGGGSAG